MQSPINLFEEFKMIIKYLHLDQDQEVDLFNLRETKRNA